MGEGKEFEVLIPDEAFQTLNFDQENFPGVAVVNINLATFEPKEVFGWNCSVILECEDTMDNGMPSKEESLIIDAFGDFLDDNIKGEDKEQPNALFLARVTWKNTRQLIWRVFDLENVETYFADLTKKGTHKRSFDYSIDYDATWELTEWYLKDRG